MKRIPWLVSLSWALATPLAMGQAQPPIPVPVESAPTTDSGMDGLMFYQLLLGEMNSQMGEPGAGFSLLLDAARKSGDEALYQRTVEMALQARSGDAALQAARAWKQALPQSRTANRYVLQILVALNRVADSGEPLRTELQTTPDDLLGPTLAAVIRTYARVTDKKLAAALVEQGLKDRLDKPATGAISWATVGRMRQLAGDTAGALNAALKGRAVDKTAEAPVFVALELIDPKTPEAEALVKDYLAGKPSVEIRIAYARALIDAQRLSEAAQQIEAAIQQQPERPDSWLILGVLQLQDGQTDAAEKALQRYLKLAESLPADERQRGNAQAFMSLAQIAEKRRDFAGAEKWLARIDNPQELAGIQFRRASILARQGKLTEARELIRSLPEQSPADVRQKLVSEVQLLRENKRYQEAYDLLGRALAAEPSDADLLYDRAMLAEKLGLIDDMERQLRQIIQSKPDFHQAYNALGYLLADRNQRLPEAKALIQKALEFAPGDPFIRDSLGWVEFRMGNHAEALQVLEAAYRQRPDAEIAAHLGEVLWVTGQRERAARVWNEGLMLNAESEPLQDVMKRFKVTP